MCGLKNVLFMAYNTHIGLPKKRNEKKKQTTNECYVSQRLDFNSFEKDLSTIWSFRAARKCVSFGSDFYFFFPVFLFVNAVDLNDVWCRFIYGVVYLLCFKIQKQKIWMQEINVNRKRVFYLVSCFFATLTVYLFYFSCTTHHPVYDNINNIHFAVIVFFFCFWFSTRNHSSGTNIELLHI